MSTKVKVIIGIVITVLFGIRHLGVYFISENEICHREV